MPADEAKAVVRNALAKNVYLATEQRHDHKNTRTQQVCKLKTSRRKIFSESPQLMQMTYARENLVPIFEGILFRMQDVQEAERLV